MTTAFHETTKHFHRFLKLAGKFRMLVILPRIAQRSKASLQRGHGILEVTVESLQLLRKTLQFIWIDNRF